MNAAGYRQTGNGPGNGTEPRTNKVDTSSSLYQRCRKELETKYPRLARDRFFPSIESYMVVCDMQDRALYLGGFNYMLNTPDDFDPALSLVFTYASGVVKMQAVWE